ncbi:MAG: LPS translocon maturation chaperone LptM [Pseudomonadota bacterium]
MAIAAGGVVPAALAGCGQKGPLVLPAQAAPAADARAVPAGAPPPSARAASAPAPR